MTKRSSKSLEDRERLHEATTRSLIPRRREDVQTIAYDAELMRPGCVLLQAAAGCKSTVAYRFDDQDWLLSPTPHLCVYEVTEDQLTILVEKTRAARRARGVLECLSSLRRSIKKA